MKLENILSEPFHISLFRDMHSKAVVEYFPAELISVKWSYINLTFCNNLNQITKYCCTSKLLFIFIPLHLPSLSVLFNFNIMLMVLVGR